MRLRPQSLAAAVAVSLLCLAPGCTDAHPALAPSPSARLTTVVSPDGAVGDPDPVHPVKIHSATVDVMIPYDRTEAYLTGSMRFDSYHARISAHASVIGPNAYTQSFFPQEQHTGWAFYDKTFNAQWRLPLADNCGHRVMADMRFDVWWIYSGGSSLTTASSDGFGSGSLPACQADDEDEPGPGGGPSAGGPLAGGGGTMRCYTRTVDHYWYDLQTGEYQYRYTETERWCEDMA